MRFLLVASLVVHLLFSTGALGQNQAKGRSTAKELFGQEQWYKTQAGKEQNFTGVLRVAKGGGGIGFGRFNPYRLEMQADGKIATREVYMGGKLEWLKPYIGKTVRIVGKAVDMEVEGSAHHEIWPASLQVIDVKQEGAKNEKIGEVKIYKTAPWPFVRTDPNNPTKPKQFVIRTVEELTSHPPFCDLDALPQVVEKQAMTQVCKLLGVENLDWNKQMLIVVTGGVRNSGGYFIDIPSITKKGDKLIVQWYLQPPQGFATNAFTHPARMALVDRFEGTVEFKMVPGPRKDKKIRPRRKIQGVRATILSRTSQVPDFSGENEVPRVNAKTVRPLGSSRGNQVIRTEKELGKILRQKGDAGTVTKLAAKVLGVKDIDWSKQMIVALDGGPRPTGGYHVELSKLTVKDKTLTVHWKVVPPRPGSIVTQAFTRPALTILMDKFDGKVEFSPARAKGKGSGLEEK